jgi:hypothetical protein
MNSITEKKEESSIVRMINSELCGGCADKGLGGNGNFGDGMEHFNLCVMVT